MGRRACRGAIRPADEPDPQGGTGPGQNGTPGYDCSGATGTCSGAAGTEKQRPKWLRSGQSAHSDSASASLADPEGLDHLVGDRWPRVHQRRRDRARHGSQLPGCACSPSTGPRWQPQGDIAQEQSEDGPFVPDTWRAYDQLEPSPATGRAAPGRRGTARRGRHGGPGDQHTPAKRPSTSALGKWRGGTSSHSASHPGSRPQISAAITAFTASYAAFLDGAPAAGLKDASITATAQAGQDGRIPVAFRDGILHLSTVSSLQSTCCSAEQTVVLANRQERYPFTVSLLNDGPHGWQVASLVPVDLSTDRATRPVTGFEIPAAGRAAARAFAVAYFAFRAGTGPAPTAMTRAAASAIASGQDSLAGAQLPTGAVSLEAIKYGPPSGDEFAATATVAIASARESFTFLMTLTAGSWKAAAFL